MSKFIKNLALVATVVAAPLAFTAGAAYAEGERFVLISHAPDSDSWWNTISAGFDTYQRNQYYYNRYRNDRRLNQ